MHEYLLVKGDKGQEARSYFSREINLSRLRSPVRAKELKYDDRYPGLNETSIFWHRQREHGMEELV